ncbi:MAG: protein-disulfide reductase DsbD N-terminal domain-containing protein [Muribaculaceae bacterium]|nr:protein-disulfide reductase DsbD N-terminal domain-containing protein [Muribaculaceae bacterium]MDE6346360.1 protein-disulfide reductase DsbD N-terminal domain-containing protein [Muribaculaceae bacterium]
MKRIIAALIAIVACVASYAQMPAFKGAPSTASWSSRIEMTGKKSGRLILTMSPAKGWHVYGFEVGKGGPKAMSADFDKSTGIKFKGELKPSVAPVKTHDDIFDIDVTYWESKVVFTRDFEVTDPATAKITGTVNYQGCNGETCNAPQKYNIALTVPSGK